MAGQAMRRDAFNDDAAIAVEHRRRQNVQCSSAGGFRRTKGRAISLAFRESSESKLLFAARAASCIASLRPFEVLDRQEAPVIVRHRVDQIPAASIEFTAEC